MLSASECYRAVQSRESRFDGVFFTAVTTTGIYCRPSCPAKTPLARNVCFYPTAAAAQSAGFRACKRCRPGASPGSPEWNIRADITGRAMRLIGEGVVDREGVGELAKRLGYSERQVYRQLHRELGAGPIALARAQRCETARMLLEMTDLPMSEIAFAAGFHSVRQFNETARAVFAQTPSEIRHSRAIRRDSATGSGAIELRLAFRRPFELDGLFGFLATRAVVGLEEADDSIYRRVLRLQNGLGILECSRSALSPEDSTIGFKLWLDDLRDLTSAVARCRRLFDLDANPLAILDALGGDPHIGRLVRSMPGLRLPGHVDPE
ncbi:MAG TPA: AlkA N-terminal domain-containing protein, partial [Acidimicrobiales bacterium]|nr:AlkA N-terminal domain-containing protein [Acidimicrobiales bacterium]